MIKDLPESSIITVAEDPAAFAHLVDAMYSPCMRVSPVNEECIDVLSGDKQCRNDEAT